MYAVAAVVFVVVVLTDVDELDVFDAFAYGENGYGSGRNVERET